eukprot:33515-Eustigmatos_ZCMA.PRE.1
MNVGGRGADDHNSRDMNWKMIGQMSSSDRHAVGCNQDWDGWTYEIALGPEFHCNAIFSLRSTT